MDQEAERGARRDRGEHAGGVAPEVERDDREGAAEIAQTPAASPSIPSEKLTTFINGDEPEHRERPAGVAELDRAV